MDNTEDNRLLSDTPMPQSLYSRPKMTWREWVLFRCKHKPTVARVLVRAGFHQVIYYSVKLQWKYPAIPLGLNSADDVWDFWRDDEIGNHWNPEDLDGAMLLRKIWEWIYDADQLVAELIQNGEIKNEEVKDIIDAELPGLPDSQTKRYLVSKPEFRGLLLALELGRAYGLTRPKLFENFLGWLREQGIDHTGRPLL